MNVSLWLDYDEAVALRAQIKEKPFPAVIEDIVALLDDAIANEIERRGVGYAG